MQSLSEIAAMLRTDAQAVRDGGFMPALLESCDDAADAIDAVMGVKARKNAKPATR